MVTVADLRKNALFADVKVTELRRILPTLRNEYYPRSAQICREGEPGASLYLILSGQVKLTSTEDTHTETIAYLNAGDFFGESAVLTDELRTVTGEAIIDAEILIFSQQHFFELVERDPTVMHNVIRSIDKRLRRKTLGLFHQQPKPSQIVSLYSPKKTPTKTFLAVNLAVSLAVQTEQSIVILDMAINEPNIAEILQIGTPQTIGAEEITEEQIRQNLSAHPAGFHLLTMSAEFLRNGKISREQIASALSILKTLFQYVIINTSTEISNNTFEALDLSNTVVLLAPIGEEPPVGMFDHQDIVGVYYFPPESQASDIHLTEAAPLIIPPSWLAEKHFYDRGDLLVNVSPTDEVSITLHRIARSIADMRIGLALGGLAARGLSHIGVLAVLEENNIPIDLITGSNTGSIIGAMYALGLKPAEIEKIVLHLAEKWPLMSLRDLDIFRGGLLNLRRIIKFLAEYIPAHLTFHQLKIPLRMITMSLEVGKEVPLNSGSLLKAMEASLAMPGIFAPMKHDGAFLVDGSTINPVPISDLIEMDADILVGVNSFAPLTPSYTPPPLDYVNLSGYAESLKMIDIIIRAFQNLQYEISTAKAMIADVTIAPELVGYAWHDFKKAQGIITAGRKAAEQALPELLRVIKNRRTYKKL